MSASAIDSRSKALVPTLDHAISLRDAGEYERSRQMLEVLVEHHAQHDGPTSCNWQCATSQLGRTLRAMDCAAQARDLHWRVLAIRLNLYGKRHYFTVNSAGILADTLRMFDDEGMASAVEHWLLTPTACEDHATARVEEQLRLILAGQAAETARFVAQLIHDYLGRPVVDRQLSQTGIGSLPTAQVVAET